MLERLLWLAILLRPNRGGVLSDGKSAGDYCGGVFAKRQLDCAHALWRAAVHQAAGNVRGHRADQLALRRSAGVDGPASIRDCCYLNGSSFLLVFRPAIRPALGPGGCLDSADVLSLAGQV